MAVKKFYHDIDLVSVGQLLNARLHNVDSTARATLAATPLTVDHKGLQVWDTDDNAPYIWNGVAWLRDALVITGDVVFRGTIDASVSLDAQATAEAGNQYVVSTAGTPSMTGVTFTPSSAVELGDVILFTSSSAATVLQRNLEDAIVDADFASAGLMTTDGSGNYTVTTNNSSNWNTAFGWGDHAAQGYITSETNDLTSAVTWANVPNANITESSVTQHQGALSINESQITFTSAFIELTDLSIGTPSSASGSGSIAYNNTTGVVTYTPPDLSSYLTSYTETNDLTSAVTWANVPNANITESSVTQHQGALSITESQISDLQSYLTSETSHADVLVDGDFATAGFMKTDGAGNYTVDNSTYLTSYTETNDLTSAVTWANVPNANITESSVTQHQGALSINESQITFTSAFIELTDLSVGTNAAASGSGGIAYNNTTGVVTYTPPELSGIATNANAIGTLSSLETTQKANLVAAINEMRGALPKTYFNGTVTLTADTEITIAHALELTNKDSYIITVADTTGSQVSVDIDSVDTNNLKITSSVALTGIKVAIIGF